MPLRDIHTYKGHEMGTREDGKIVISAYDREFPSMDAAHAWVDQHVAAEAKKSSTPFSVLDLVKGTAAHRSAFNLAKAGSGEGSRGGNVIGHTSSGKPIYASKKAVSHKGFSSADHHHAGRAHLRLATDGLHSGDQAKHDHHSEQAHDHFTAAYASEDHEAIKDGAPPSGQHATHRASKRMAEHHKRMVGIAKDPKHKEFHRRTSAGHSAAASKDWNGVHEHFSAADAAVGFRRSDDASSPIRDMVKGKKPPAGYTPIPGGKKGGYRKRKGAGWDYWYADKQGGGGSGDKAAHHKKQAAHHKKMADKFAEDYEYEGERDMGRDVPETDTARYHADMHHVAHLAHRAAAGEKLSGLAQRTLQRFKGAGWKVDQPDRLSAQANHHTALREHGLSPMAARTMIASINQSKATRDVPSMKAAKAMLEGIAAGKSKTEVTTAGAQTLVAAVKELHPDDDTTMEEARRDAISTYNHVVQHAAQKYDARKSDDTQSPISGDYHPSIAAQYRRGN